MGFSVVSPSTIYSGQGLPTTEVGVCDAAWKLLTAHLHANKFEASGRTRDGLQRNQELKIQEFGITIQEFFVHQFMYSNCCVAGPCSLPSRHSSSPTLALGREAKRS